MVFAGNVGNSTVTEYAPNSSGNVAPTTTLTNGLSEPFSLFIDSLGRLWAANYKGNSITAYAAGATGNAAPTVTISGASTQLNGPDGIVIDKNGVIYVANFNLPSINIYAPGSNGNVAPSTIITGNATAQSGFRGLALLSNNDIVAGDCNNGRVDVFVNPGLGHGTQNAAPVRSITGPTAAIDCFDGVAVDGHDNIYSADYAGQPGGVGIYEFAAGATGASTPLRFISGANTLVSSPFDLKLDANNNVYVADENNGVLIFAAGANGNVAPSQKISGASTGLNIPYGVAIH